MPKKKHPYIVMVSDAEAFRQALAAMAAEYRASLPATLAHISALMATLRQDGYAGAALAMLRRELHTLAGSAGTFGCDEVGSAAAHAEAFLDDFDHARSWTELDCAQLDERVAAVAQNINNVAPGRPASIP